MFERSGQLKFAHVFKSECADIIAQHNVLAKNVINSDETRFQFGSQKMASLHVQGAKTVYIKGSRNDKRGVSVLASIAADGSRLPLAFIFKGKKGPKNLTIPEPHLKFTSGKGWMNEVIWLQYAKKVWFTRAPSQHLVHVYTYASHNSDNYLHACTNHNVHNVNVPAAMTGTLQPFDRLVDGPWKNAVAHAINEYYEVNENDISWQQLIDIIIAKWNENMSQVLVEKSFAKTGVIKHSIYKEDIPIEPPVARNTTSVRQVLKLNLFHLSLLLKNQ